MSEPLVTPDLPAVRGGTPIRPEGPPEWPPDDPAVAEALQQCLADRSWGKYHGPHCQRLTAALGELHGCEHAVLCASGTVAVELALRGLKVGPGDEVVLAAYDFKGNFANVLTVGATPVLVDLHPDNWNLNPRQLEGAITRKTRAIIVSHLHGGVVPMPAVTETAQRHGVPVIEDACQMPGSTIHGRVAGMWGDVGILSFGGSKLLSAGRGGAIVTNNGDIVQRMRLYSHRGNDAYPLSELQAAVLLPQVKRLDSRNRKRAENAQLLFKLLQNVDGLAPFRNPESNSQPGYYKVGLRYDPSAFGGMSRDDFAAAMRAEGIALDPGFRALHLMHSKRRFRAAGELPVAAQADVGAMKLHHPVLLEGQGAIEQIAAAAVKIQQHIAG